jgi:hypothetical protein
VATAASFAVRDPTLKQQPASSALLTHESIRSLITQQRNARRKEGAMSRQSPALTLSDARAIIAAGERKAQELGVPYNGHRSSSHAVGA